MFDYSMYLEQQRREAERRRIRAIISQLRAVSNAINSLNSSCSSAHAALQSNVMIDDRPFKNEAMEDIKSSVSSARDGINNIINSLYSLMGQI